MIHPNFTVASNLIRNDFRTIGRKVQTSRWQGVDVAAKPDMQMVEMFNTSLTVPMSHRDIEALQVDTGCNMPWAEEHFQERVAGEPVNPGKTWRTWPWGNSADKFRDANGQFNHNYMERYWPKFAGECWLMNGDMSALREPATQGIRWKYGDLDDVVSLMQRDPYTRQAYLPVWFPEDTGVGDGGRKPCTLGYHFMMRNDRLHITYYIRSCDFIRHFADDCYLTARLAWWMIDQLRDYRDGFWDNVRPGMFVMHIASLHMFVNDYITMFGEEPR